MKKTLKSISLAVLGLCCFVGFIVLATMLIQGGVWVGERVYPWLSLIGALTFFLTLLVFLPLALFRRTRAFAGIATLYASYVFGINLWVYGLLLSYTIWGITGILVGLFIAGVGVVPVAMLATLFKGMWGTFGELVFLTAMTIGSRFLGAYLMTKAEATREPGDDPLSQELLAHSGERE